MSLFGYLMLSKTFPGKFNASLENSVKTKLTALGNHRGAKKAQTLLLMFFLIQNPFQGNIRVKYNVSDWDIIQ